MFLDLYEVWAVTDDEHFVIGIFTDVNNWYYLCGTVYMMLLL